MNSASPAKNNPLAAAQAGGGRTQKNKDNQKSISGQEVSKEANSKMELYNLFNEKRFCTIREIFADFAAGNNGEIIGLWLYKGIHGSYSMVMDPDCGEGL